MRRAGVKAAAAAAASWLELAEPWAVLGLSLFRKWELPALLGAGPLPR